MFEFKPDFDKVLNRFEAWWRCEVTDRAPVSITVPKPGFNAPAPKAPATVRERWLDTDFVVARWQYRLGRTLHLGDALPVAYPNLGPEVFSAFYGCEMDYGEHTGWSKPIMHDWSAKTVASVKLDRNNFYFRKLVEMTDALISAGRGKFIVGYTDLHGGGDAVAAFREPQDLLIDCIEHPAEIRAMVDRITVDFLEVYDFFHARLSAAGMPSTTWLPLTGRGKFHIPSCDFSCMVSEQTFDDLFVPAIASECAHMDRCIYHLDGPQALRYLDKIMDIPGIQAIQWVAGAGHDDWMDSIPVFKRIQARGKAVQIPGVHAKDLPSLFKALKPEGVWISSMQGIETVEQAGAVLKAVEKWDSR